MADDTAQTVLDTPDNVSRAAALIPDSFFGGLAPGESQPGIPPEKPPLAQTPGPGVANAPKVEPPKTEPAGQQDGQKVQEPPKEQPTLSKMAEAIRQDREERARRVKDAEDAKNYKSELDKVRGELESLKKASNFEADPFAFIKGRNLSPEAQSMLGQALLYDLVPDKAPVEFRQRLFEMKLEAQKAREAEAAKAEQEKRDEEFRQQQINGYVADLRHGAAQFAPGTYAESESFFVKEDDAGNVVVDHDAYVQSLFATANNMAIAASKRGQQADLSPANVARVLEAEVARRSNLRTKFVAARDKQKQAVPPVVQQPQVNQNAPQQRSTSTEGAESTSGLGGGGPRPPATTDEERIQRAAAALWGGR